jgi:hypothetical protein
VPPISAGTPDDHAAKLGPAVTGFATVKGAAAFPAARIPRPTAERAQGMLRGEVAGIQALLRELSDAEWQRPAGSDRTVRDLVLGMICRYEEISGSGRMPPIREAADFRHRHLDHARAAALAGQLIAELGYWAGQAAISSPRYRDRKASIFRPGAPATLTASYLFRVILPREAWLDRITIAEATGRPLAPGPYGAEIVRQATRDISDTWAGPPVQVEITEAAGGRWLIADGTPVATVRADPAGYLRLITGHPAGQMESSGDTAAVAAFAAVPI